MKSILFILFFLSFEARATECAKDVKKFCDNVSPGKGQLAKCLADFEGQLSPLCAKELKEFKKNVVKKNPCFEDMTEFCADLPSDPKNYEYCFLKHEARLSPLCMADFKKKKSSIIVKDVCAQDVAMNCYKEISEPDGAITRCLIKNRTKLSGHCQKKVDKKVIALKKRNPCYDDTEKFCPTQVKFLDIQDCLAKKVSSLNLNCQKLVKKETDKLKANPCYRDLLTHCKPKLAPKEQNECLTLNDEHLSNACKQFRAVESEKVSKMVKLCEADRLKLCPKVPFKNGQVLKCLRKNKIKTSTECAKLL